MLKVDEPNIEDAGGRLRVGVGVEGARDLPSVLC